MLMKITKFSLGAIAGGLLLTGCISSEKKQTSNDYNYWDLGVGGYGSGLVGDITHLDRARMDCLLPEGSLHWHSRWTDCR